MTTPISTGQGGDNEKDDGQVCQPAAVSKETISMGDCEEHCHAGPRFDRYSVTLTILFLLLALYSTFELITRKQNN